MKYLCSKCFKIFELEELYEEKAITRYYLRCPNCSNSDFGLFTREVEKDE